MSVCMLLCKSANKKGPQNPAKTATRGIRYKYVRKTVKEKEMCACVYAGRGQTLASY